MILDQQLTFSDAQAKATGVFDSAADFDSTNIVDLSAAGDRLEDMYLVIRVDTAVQSAGSATVGFSLQTCATINGTYSTLLSTAAIAKTSLTANTEVLKARVPLGVKRFLKVVYTVGTAALTAGKFDAFLTPAVDTNFANV